MGLKYAFAMGLLVSTAACTQNQHSTGSVLKTAITGSVSQDRLPANNDAKDILQCIKKSGALAGKKFAVGPFNNDTGKFNNVADGATGSFLPAGPNLSIYAMEALKLAGGQVFDYANLDVTRNIATIGGKVAIQHLHERQNSSMPNYAVSATATALDFSGAQKADIRIAGIGPVVQRNLATAYYATHITEPGSQRSVASGHALTRSSYTRAGLGVSRFFGGGSGTLVTGEISAARQEPLQRPTAEGIILSVAFALLEFPGAQGCRPILEGSTS